MKNKILLLLVSINFLTFKASAQIDTAIIFSEIRNLKTDDMIKSYCEGLSESDQNLHTFNNPVLQTENLVKAIYLFKYFDFSKNEQIKEYFIEVYPDIIWIHQPFVDLSFYTYPLLFELYKLRNETFDGGTYKQNIELNRVTKNNSNLGVEVDENLNALSFDKIDIDKVCELAFEFMMLYRVFGFKGKDIEVGIWTYGENRRLSIVQSDNNDFYLVGGNFFKLNKINDTVFHFATNVDGNYLEIAENGDLLNKDKNGNTIEVFKKKVFKY